MELIVIEKSAYLRLKQQVKDLSVQVEVCLALNISKRSLQSYRDYGIIPCSFIGGKYMYKESDLVRILIQKDK